MISLLATLLLSTPAVAPAPESIVNVTLPLEASVDGSEITLGDIADVQGDVTSEVALLRDFNVGYSPAPGYSRVVQRWRLEQRVKRQHPGLTVNFLGESACRVWPRTAEITPEELEVAARQALADELGTADVEVALHRELASEIVPAGRESRRIEPDRAGAQLRSGTVNVPLRILIDEVKYRTVWVSFDVTLYRELPVLRRPIPLGGTIQEGDLVLRRTPVEASFRGEMLTPAKLIGATARRSLSQGRPVSTLDVTRMAAVQQGETVTLEIKNGQVLVSTKVLCMNDGFLGDVVAIRTLETGKELTAVVVQKGRLELRLGQNTPQ